MAARTIMIQGTGSHVGKSYLTAGLCRIFYSKGLSVAPFKSQNMALNSYVTDDGGEIGRAQAVQAMAAGRRPTVDMNPILLKPQSDRRSQVIIKGRVYSALDAGAYYSRKKEWLPVWSACLRKLREAHDLVVIEGAGSPAEINLVDYDIANMAVASEASAPVLLVTDIDRGGAFASLYGTYALLPEEDRRRVGGFIINKFRGDPALLEEGLRMIEEMTGVPVLGVVPFLDIELEEEDSVALTSRRETERPRIRIAVPRLPRIANFTDLFPFEQVPDVGVDYVASPRDIPDAVIMPGSKTTISDLRWLKTTGLADWIRSLAAAGVPVFGICGGYQMLGAFVSDPLGIEGSPGDAEEGLGLLPVESELRGEKTVKQAHGKIAGGAAVLGRAALGAEVAGYEVHAGITRPDDSGTRCVPLLSTGDGCSAEERAVAGTYMHGFFDNGPVISSFLDTLAERAGVEPVSCLGTDFNSRIDRLADALRDSLDMERIERLIEAGSPTGVEVGAG